MQKVLFICTHNSARSQMAEALLRSKFSDRYQVFSAGTEPSNINPYIKRVMNEIGIDISGYESKHVNLFLGEEIDLVVTLCDSAKESCPFFPGAKQYDHKNFPDPSRFTGTEEEILNRIRGIREELSKWIDQEFNTIQE
ncbi:MAG: arsenate reductase ArsC [Candidatus Hodarchaeota archaeon]